MEKSDTIDLVVNNKKGCPIWTSVQWSCMIKAIHQSIWKSTKPHKACWLISKNYHFWSFVIFFNFWPTLFKWCPISNTKRSSLEKLPLNNKKTRNMKHGQSMQIHGLLKDHWSDSLVYFLSTLSQTSGTLNVSPNNPEYLDHGLFIL